MSNIHLSIYPETANDVIRGVLDFIRADDYPTLCYQWFDSDNRVAEAIVSSYEPNWIDQKMEELRLDTFGPIEGVDDVKVDSSGLYRFNNGKYYIITLI